MQWHFAIMWILIANFLVYISLNLVSGRLREKLLPLNLRTVIADLAAALRARLQHEDLGRYNAVLMKWSAPPLQTR